MQSFRQRMKVQKQHKEPQAKMDPFQSLRKNSYSDTRTYLIKTINTYNLVSKQFEPLSDEWNICINDMFKHKADLEILERGTQEDRKEVIKKYGRGNS